MEHALTRSIVTSLALLTLLSGCEWLDKFNTVKVDNPVMGPPPPRIAMPDDRIPGASIVRAKSDDESGEGTLDVRPVDFQKNSLLEEEDFTATTIVAMVNGSPIFAADILEPYAGKLKLVEGQASESEMRMAKRQIIQKDLPSHIDNKLLLTAIHKMLKKEQREGLEKHLDEEFEKIVALQMKDLGLSSRFELDERLQKEHGRSLESMHTSFANNTMADAYLKEKAKSQNREVGRDDLLAYYNDHLDDYAYPAMVRWQQIEVSFGKHGDKRRAFAYFEQAVEKLKPSDGDPTKVATFAAVADEFSDDSRAKNGGDWGWTRQGSLADKQVEKILFELPVGTISAPIVGDQSFRLVKVVDRKAAGCVQFADLQDKIKEEILKSREKVTKDDILAELRANAIIETTFDNQKERTAKDDSLPFR